MLRLTDHSPHLPSDLDHRRDAPKRAIARRILSRRSLPRRAHEDAHGNVGRPRICRTAHGGARFSATRRGRRGYFARQAEFKWGQSPSPPKWKSQWG